MKPIKGLVGEHGGFGCRWRSWKVRSGGRAAEPGEVRVMGVGAAAALVVVTGLREVWPVVGRVKGGMDTVCFAVAPPVAGQSGPWTWSHLSVSVLFSGWELTAQRKKIKQKQPCEPFSWPLSRARRKGDA